MADMKKRHTRIVSIEGPDGVGKTTQTQLLLKNLVHTGKRAVALKLPMARMPTGRVIYSMLDSGSARRWPTVFQAIQLVDKLVPQLACLPFLLATQDYVLLDRWSTSATVYGRATGVHDSFLQLGERLLVRPDAVVVLEGPNVRNMNMGDNDSYDRSAELQHRVRGEYAVWAEHNKDVAVTVDAVGTVDDVSCRIWNALVDKEVV